MAYKRFFVSDLGEYHMDCLKVEAALKRRNQTAEAASLLITELDERQNKRENMVAYLAKKRNLSYDEIWTQLLTGTYVPTVEEIKEMEENEE